MDLVFLITDSFLDPAAALCLCLTCKDLFNALFVKSKLGDSDLEEFLLLLEKEASCQPPMYYCHICIRLHVFKPPHGQCSHAHPNPEDCRFNHLRLSRSQGTVEYGHARLVMNRHFFGIPHGLPLSTFDVTTYHWSDYSLFWRQDWTAKVIEDELFLSVKHTLQFSGTEADFRSILDRRWYSICRHVETRKEPKFLCESYEQNLIRQQISHEREN